MTGGRQGPLGVSRYDVATRSGMRHDTTGRHATRLAVRARHGLGHNRILYRDRGQRQQRCNTAHQRARGRNDTERGACDTAGEGATTGPSMRHDTALCVRLCGCSGRAARVCWVCTQLSFDSVHCYE